MATAAWQAAAIALAIGFLIGAERERDGGPAGVRTFALAGLAGTIAALLHPLVLAAAVAGAAVLMAAGYLRPTPASPPTEEEGATEPSGPTRARLSTASAVALLLTVLLGGLAVTMPALAAAAGVTTAVLLLVKKRLHTVIREKITELELRDALKFFVAAFIVLPLMPQANLGPGGVVDPRRMWTFVVAVTALGWLGYVAVRLAGPERGLPAAGLAGGFVSSAATTGAMARTARDPELFRPAMAGALLATVASLVQLVLVTAVADTQVAGLLVPATALAAVVLLAEAGWLLWSTGGRFPDLLTGGRTSGDRTSGDRTEAERTEAERTEAERTDVDRADVDRADADRTDVDQPEPEPAGPEDERVSVPARPSRRPIVIEGATVTKIDFGASSRVDFESSTVDPSRPAVARSSVDEPTREMPVVDSPAVEMPPVRRRSPRMLVGRRPFDLIPALLLTAILTLFLVVSAFVKETLGAGAAVVAIAVAGLADSRAAALTAGDLANHTALTAQAGALAAALALGVHTVVKLVLAHVAGGRRASTALALLFAAPTIAFVTGLLLAVSLS
ncbi:MAG: MgtC/SapB family protein [Micromonosporaceae bacterium]|nr:MgtC/SapB family protein [Micromonosporaceae bacterium]